MTTLATVTKTYRVWVTTYTLGRTSRIYETRVTTHTEEITYRTPTSHVYVTYANVTVTTALATVTPGGALSATAHIPTIGLVALVGLVFVGGYFLGNRRRSTMQLASSSAQAEARRYAELLSRLEDLRVHQELPERIHSKLEEEYMQRLRAALETTE